MPGEVPAARHFKRGACLEYARLQRWADSATRSWQTAPVGTCTMPAGPDWLVPPRIVCPMSTFVFHSRKRIPALVTGSRARNLAHSLLPKELPPSRRLVFSLRLAQTSIGWLRIPALGTSCLPTANHRSSTLVCAQVRLCPLLPRLWVLAG